MVVAESKENASWALTANYGMRLDSALAKKPIYWPSTAFFKGRQKAFIAQLFIKRIEWHEDTEGAIDTLRLTLNDGSTSPKIGVNSAELDKSLVLGGIKAIRTIELICSQQKIIQIDLIDGEKNNFATIGKNSLKKLKENSDMVKTKLKLKQNERLIGLEAVERKPL